MLRLFPLFILICGALTDDLTEYVTSDESCAGRCDENLIFSDILNNTFTCFCSPKCVANKDCCVDYVKECWDNAWPSCLEKCENDVEDPTMPCQCGPICVENDNCCPEYHRECLLTTVSNRDIQDLAESFLFWDKDNNMADAIILEKGHPSGENCDNVQSSPFIQMNSSKPLTDIFRRLQTLYDDYEPDVMLNETIGASEARDESLFIADVSKTILMRALQRFLNEKKFVLSSMFSPTITRIWFEHYSRTPNGASLGSSGFENVFLGEVDEGKIIGFHNWFYYISETKHNKIEYTGYENEIVLSKKASVYNINFKWNGNCQSTHTSMFVGTSPEFEFALYTLCYFTRPNQLCKVLLGGKEIFIQTNDKINHLGQRLVETAYPVILSNGASHHLYTFPLLIVMISLITYFK